VSAVAGLCTWNGHDVGTADVERMVAAVAPRGPDGDGAWSDGRVALGYRGLATTLENLHERLPLVSPGGGLILTADARIDNRREVITVLGLAGRLCEEISDSEIILAAYERWGDRAAEHLLGDFAFAVWDRRRRELLCARDRLGVRPFYYVTLPRTFAFASGIAALLALPEVPRRLNEASVASYLAGLVGDKTSTFYRDVQRLPPGHCLSLRDDTIRTWPYWRLDPEREAERQPDAAWAEAFRAHFVDAARCRLRTTFPVGATLSGGLDSSSVACAARDLRRQSGEEPLPTFSVIFPDLPRTDELRLVNVVLRDGGFVAHHVRADRLDLLADLEGERPPGDEPESSTLVLLHEVLFRRARQEGVRVVLDGLGGDAAVSHGAAYPRELARRGRWLALAGEVTAFSRAHEVSAPRLLWQSVRPLAPGWLRAAKRRVVGPERPPWELAINPGLARRVGLKELWDALQQAWRNGARTARHDHWRRLDSPVVTHDVETVGRVASRCGIEVRHPFLDSRLVEFALALPGDQKLRGGRTRVILREAMAGLLPEEIRWRKGKADHGPILPHVLARAGTRRLGTALDREAETLSGYVNLPAVRATLARWTPTPSTEDALVLWRALTLGVWLRRTGLA
jgi:asparagine synthase (glutamine-hydrolysing)